MGASAILAVADLHPLPAGVSLLLSGDEAPTPAGSADSADWYKQSTVDLEWGGDHLSTLLWLYGPCIHPGSTVFRLSVGTECLAAAPL